ncbi:hypothetical protein [Kitasatospora sp. NPDC001527]|uniref:hypothetical protein n=1 Tax=Kitasatospora sp. NPDC001527 TaxID=3154519 RepID=UPI00332A46C2
MTDNERPEIRPGVDPLDDLVITVRGDGTGTAPNYELPPTVSLNTASAILGLPADVGRRRAADGTYPVDVITLGATRRVGTAPLIRAAGLDKVREALRPGE